MEMGRNPGFGKRRDNSGTSDDILTIASGK
jgi:hypothetical protein